MKTPEEIKKGLECCGNKGCNNCPYFWSCPPYYSQSAKDALDYIKQLESLLGLQEAATRTAEQRVAELESRLAQAERERDALWFDLARMPSACDVCAHGVQNDADCDELFGHNNGCEFKWRGPCPENTEENAK